MWRQGYALVPMRTHFVSLAIALLSIMAPPAVAQHNGLYVTETTRPQARIAVLEARVAALEAEESGLRRGEGALTPVAVLAGHAMLNLVEMMRDLKRSFEAGEH